MIDAAIDQIARACAEDNYRFSSLMIAIVRSRRRSSSERGRLRRGQGPMAEIVSAAVH